MKTNDLLLALTTPPSRSLTSDLRTNDVLLTEDAFSGLVNLETL